MRILRIGFVFGGFLSLILSLSTQTARGQSKPAPHPAGQSSEAAQAKPKYKAIWEPVNYTEDISLNSVYFVSAQTGWVSSRGAWMTLAPRSTRSRRTRAAPRICAPE